MGSKIMIENYLKAEMKLTDNSISDRMEYIAKQVFQSVFIKGSLTGQSSPFFIFFLKLCHKTPVGTT